jgi:hypothetical protein
MMIMMMVFVVFVATDAVANAAAVCHHQIIYIRIGVGVGFCQKKNNN